MSRGKRQKTGDKAQPRPVAHAPPDLAAAPCDNWPAPSAEDYLTDPLYPDDM